MIAKLVYGSEIHLFKGQLTLSTLREHCLAVFKALKFTNKKLEFSYLDEDGDKINVTC